MVRKVVGDFTLLLQAHLCVGASYSLVVVCFGGLCESCEVVFRGEKGGVEIFENSTEQILVKDE